MTPPTVKQQSTAKLFMTPANFISLYYTFGGKEGFLGKGVENGQIIVAQNGQCPKCFGYNVVLGKRTKKRYCVPCDVEPLRLKKAGRKRPA